MREDPLAEAYSRTEPPERLYGRVVSSLRSEGRLTSVRSRTWRRAAAVGALAAATALGFVAGRSPWTGRAESDSRFLLLLYEDAAYRDDRPVEAIVAEYGRWADSLRRHGALIMGEKLADSAVPLSLEQRTIEQLARGPSGFFVLRAADADSAAAIARTVPHLRYGGTIKLYPIETTPRGRSGG